MLTITREELKTLYQDKTNIDVVKKLGISQPTLIKLIKANNIPLKGKGKKHLIKVQVVG